MLVPETTDELFKQISQNNNIKDKNEVYKNALKEYLKYIVFNQQNLDFISKQVLEKYLEGEKIIVDKNNKLKNLVLKKDQFNLNSSSLKYLLLFQKFSKWKRLIKNNVLQEKGNQTFDEKLLSKEELKECTFHPRINSNYISLKKEEEKDKKEKVFDRLYNDYQIYNLKREMKVNESEQLHKNSFSPKLNRTPKKFNKISNQSFSERLKIYQDKKKENIEKISIKKEEGKQYTFQPHLNENRGKSKNLEIKNKKLEEENKPKLIKRNVDKQRIENLFSSYKEKQNKIEKIKLAMEKDEGITFKPYYETENSVLAQKYNKKLGQDDFLKRYEKYETLQTQRNEEKRKKYSPDKPRKIYTSKEKEIITQNIIKRLYGEGLQDYLLKNNMKKIKSEQQ